MSTLFLLGIFTNSCEVAEEPESLENLKVDVAIENSLATEREGEAPYFYDYFETVSLNDYIIKFNRVLDEKDSNGNVISTTFEYAITGTGATAQSDSFYLQVPDCAGTPDAWTPSNASKFEENRIKWNSSIPKDAVEELYTVTYPGQVALGIIEIFMVRGGVEKKSFILGPCGGYDVSGAVFIDTEGAGLGTFEASESGVGGIEVELSSDGSSSTAFTLEDGSYQFRVLQGAYTVSVLNGKDLFNDGHYINSSYSPKTVEVDQNTSGLDFGYLVDSDKVISRFESGEILLNTLSAKTWLQELRSAGKGNGIYTKQDVAGFLWEIQENLLEEETFEFGLLEDKSNVDAAIAVALDLLSRPIKSEKDLYVQQLLTAELNVTSNRGAFITGTRDLNNNFNSALLKYAEAKACQDFQICAPESDFSKAAVTVKAVSRTSSRLLSSFNGSGGL